MTITAEPFPKSNAYADLDAQGDGWIWTNWQSFAWFLRVTPATAKSLMAGDLLALLDRRGLRQFDGFASVRRLPGVEPVASILRKRARFTEGFNGFAELLTRPQVVSWKGEPPWTARR